MKKNNKKLENLLRQGSQGSCDKQEKLFFKNKLTECGYGLAVRFAKSIKL